jgi:hypothetical protein
VLRCTKWLDYEYLPLYRYLGVWQRRKLVSFTAQQSCTGGRSSGYDNANTREVCMSWETYEAKLSRVVMDVCDEYEVKPIAHMKL